MTNTNNTRYLVRSITNPAMIFCTDNDFHHEGQVGPGGWRPKLYRTHRGASSVRGGTVIVRALDERGVEVRA